MDLGPLAAAIAGRTPDTGTQTPNLRLGVSQGTDPADRTGTIRVLLDGTVVPGVTTLCGPVPSGTPVWLLETGGMLLALGVDGGLQWQNWTPTIAQGTATNITKTVTYGRWNWGNQWRSINALGKFDITGAGASGSVTLTLPVAASGPSGLAIGSGYMNDAGSAFYPFIVRLESSSTVTLLRTDQPVTSGLPLGGDPAIQLASSDMITLNMSYIPAGV